MMSDASRRHLLIVRAKVEDLTMPQKELPARPLGELDDAKGKTEPSVGR